MSTDDFQVRQMAEQNDAEQNDAEQNDTEQNDAEQNDTTPHASRARTPDTVGVAERDGVSLSYATYGTGEPAVVLMPTWSIMPSRFWKAQVPYLARYFRVVTFDGRGSGAFSRPTGAAAYTDAEYAADTVAVMDAVGVDRAVLVGLSCGTTWSVHVRRGASGARPRAVCDRCVVRLPIANPQRDSHPWDQRPSTTKGWAKYNRYHWLEGDYDGFLQFFFAEMFNEPHSTKQTEDAVGRGHEIAPTTLVDTTAGRLGCDGAVCAPLEPLCAKVRCPVTVVQGTANSVRHHAVGERLAQLTGASLILVEGAGHGLPAPEPVFVNRELKRFVDHVQRPVARTSWVRARHRPKRALYISSPIGLGHARRDVAIADELRTLHPDLQIDWLAEHPVTRVLEERHETIHPASSALASWPAASFPIFGSSSSRDHGSIRDRSRATPALPCEATCQTSMSTLPCATSPSCREA